MKARFSIVLGAIGALALGASQATAELREFRVDGDDGSPQGDGTAWGPAAVLYLQDAFAAAAAWVGLPGDNTAEIWVALAAEPYKPDQSADGSMVGDPAATFTLISKVAIYGGFTGNETALNHQ